MESYTRHQRQQHPGYGIEPEVTKDTTKLDAKIPGDKRPFEALSKSQLDQVKFRVRPADGRGTVGPAHMKCRPIVETAMEMLKADLQLSDSDTCSTASSPNQSEGEFVDYKTLNYKSTSDTTVCLDETNI